MKIDQVSLAALDRLIVAAVGITTVALAQADRAGELTFPQWRALMVIGERLVGMHVNEIAQRVGASSPSASRLVRRLERAGLVATERDEGDRRATVVRLTAAGAGVRSRVIARRRRLVTQLFRRHKGHLPRDLQPGLQAIGEILSSYV